MSLAPTDGETPKESVSLETPPPKTPSSEAPSSETLSSERLPSETPPSEAARSETPRAKKSPSKTGDERLAVGRVVAAIIFALFALAFFAAGVVLAITPANQLPSFLGHADSHTHHTLRGIGSLIVGLVFTAAAWFALRYQSLALEQARAADNDSLGSREA